MNDPVLADRSPRTPNDDEPPSWWNPLWRKLRHIVNPPTDAESLREVVEEIIEEPLSESGLSPAERMLLGNIMLFRERKAGDCMLPRADIVAADITSTMHDIIDLMAEHGHSRIPIYRGTMDDMVGMVHIKDIMPCLAYHQERPLADLLRPVLFIAPSMPAAKLLLQMRQTRHHMALVVDEYGGVDGLITIEDVVEEIVGEIDDEHDGVDAPMIIARPDGTMLADARLPLEDFEVHTGHPLPLLDGDETDTLGGYVTHLAGRVPTIGESFRTTNGFSFDILEVDQACIHRLRIRPPLLGSDEAAR